MTKKNAFGCVFTHRLGNFWSGCSQGAKHADIGGDSNTSSAIEYNSSWASTYTGEVMEVTEEEEVKEEKNGDR